MRTNRPSSPDGKTQVVVFTIDAAFAEQARATFGASDQIALKVVAGTPATTDGAAELDGAAVAVIDLDAAVADEMAALERLIAQLGGYPPVVVVTQAFDAA